MDCFITEHVLSRTVRNRQFYYRSIHGHYVHGRWVILALKKTVLLIENSWNSNLCSWRFITAAKYALQFSAVKQLLLILLFTVTTLKAQSIAEW